MGVFLNLIVNKKNIEQKEWDKAYKESCLLLRKFPAPLARLKYIEKYNQRLFVYSNDLVEEVGTKEENWRVYGDLLSYQYAEDFIFYRSLDKITLPRVVEKDVLWASEKDIDYIYGNGKDIFGNKTQGAPYHMAILAVAILLESRFPKDIYCVGDFGEEEAEKAIAWANTVLQKPIGPPIVLDSQRLYRRLKKLYKAPLLAIRRFDSLSRKPDYEALRTLLAIEDESIVLRSCQEIQRRYKDPSQLGYIRWMNTFLQATEDVKKLIEIIVACHKDNMAFDLPEILRVLGNHYITIPKEYRILFDESFFSKRDGLTSDEILQSLMATSLYALPRNINFYIDRNDLLDIFTSFAPKEKKVFQDILDESEQKCKKEFRDYTQKIKKFEENNRIENKEQTKKEAVSDIATKLPEEQHILEVVLKQRYVLGNLEESTKIVEQVGKSLQKSIIQANPDLFDKKEREYYLRYIALANKKNGPALPVSFWDKIEMEKDIKILQMLLALLFASGNGMGFEKIKRFILHNNEFWPCLIK